MFYNTGKVCKILQVSRPTLYKLCKERNVKPKKTSGGNYRFTELDLKRLMGDEKIDDRNIEEKFVELVNDNWLLMKQFAEEIWGIESGQKKLKRILEKNKNDIFILNISTFQ